MFLADPWTEQEAITRKLPAADAFVAHLEEMPIPATYADLFPDERPARWIIDPDHCDHAWMGQQVTDLPAAEAPTSVRGRRRIFDTSLPGKANRGHETMVAPLTPSGRLDVVEYLKTL